MNTTCLFVSDLHGKTHRYEKLFQYIAKEKPGALFIGGDILPSSVLHSLRAGDNKTDFITDYLAPRFENLKETLGENYPRIFLIMGNDDPKTEVETILHFENKSLWEYVQEKIVTFGEYSVFGYSYVPPTPFMLKDWERYDLDLQVQEGSIAPTAGFKTMPDETSQDKHTIKEDMEKLAKSIDMKKSILLFHSPPFQTSLDRITDDFSETTTRMPKEVFVGSKAIKQLIENYQPHITLHGHIHESSRLTGFWKEQINKTTAITAAFDGKGLAVVKFNPSKPMQAERIIL